MSPLVSGTSTGPPHRRQVVVIISSSPLADSPIAELESGVGELHRAAHPVERAITKIFACPLQRILVLKACGVHDALTFDALEPRSQRTTALRTTWTFIDGRGLV